MMKDNKSCPTWQDITADQKNMKLVKKLAEQGNSDAMALLGMCHTDGLILDMNFQLGYSWSKKASEQGNHMGIFYVLADLYEGRGVKQDRALAEKMLSGIRPEMEKMAKAGDAFWQYACGYTAKWGIGCKQDNDLAFKWFEKSARQKYPVAMCQMADHCIDPDSPDYDKEAGYLWAKECVACGLIQGYPLVALHLFTSDDAKSEEEKMESLVSSMKYAVDHGEYYASVYLAAFFIDPEQIDEIVCPYLDQLREDAENGEQDCQQLLGMVYEKGLGVEPDDDLAFYWYSRSAEQKNTESMLSLAKCVLFGQGTESDPERAIELLLAPELKNNGEALFLLFRSYVHGVGVKEDKDKALSYLKLSAEKDFTSAQFELGLRYLHGDDAPKNESEGYRLLSRAAKDDQNAVFWLGLCYLYGLGVETSEEKGGEYIKKAADNGCTDAMTYFAENFAKTPEEAFSYYEKAANAGSWDAMFEIAMRKASGNGTEKNLEEAEIIFFGLAARGHTEALNSCKDLAEKGNDKAQRTLGAYYRDPQVTTVDYKEAAKWDLKAAEQGNAAAMCHLAIAYQRGDGVEMDTQKSNEYLQKSADADFSPAITLLAENYERGSNGYEQDIAKAVALYQKAFEIDENDDAAVNLASMYMDGRGVPQNKKKGFEFYQKAADAGNPAALNQMGCYYQNGEFVKKDPKKAVECFREAASCGHLEATAHLGVCFLYGDGVHRDLNAGVKNLRMAGEAGLAAAYRKLGEFYASGNDLTSLAETKKYYKLAANAGDEAAIEWLEKRKG